MGHLIEKAKVKVALVGIDQQTGVKLTHRFQTSGALDPGLFEVVHFPKLAECNIAVSASRSEITAICIALETYAPMEATAFINEIRITSPLVSFCLVGKKDFLDNLPDYHDAWKAKLAHYYKLASDVSDADFNENAGVVRDLFVADSVKCRGLGRYETTPGQIIQIKSARPYMFWILLLNTLVAAIIGGSVGPILNRYLLPAPTHSAADQQKPPNQGAATTGTPK